MKDQKLYAIINSKNLKESEPTKKPSSGYKFLLYIDLLLICGLAGYGFTILTGSLLLGNLFSSAGALLLAFFYYNYNRFQNPQNELKKDHKSQTH